MKTALIEALEGRQFLSASVASHQVAAAHEVAAVKVAAKPLPAKAVLSPVGNFDGNYTYTRPRSFVSPYFWAIVTKRPNGKLSVIIGNPTFEYQMSGTWDAKSRSVTASYSKDGNTFTVKGTLTTNGKKITGTLVQKFKGKTYLGTFYLNRLNYDPREA